MNFRALIAAGVAAATTGTAVADYAGTPQREYMGRTYLITSVRYIGPIWYAGDGKVVRGSENGRSRLVRLDGETWVPARKY
ncbi:MAG: hypothetical protein ACR2IE_17575 [Candidatus Sumerlaeaceae bacterium]